MVLYNHINPRTQHTMLMSYCENLAKFSMSVISVSLLGFQGFDANC